MDVYREARGEAARGAPRPAGTIWQPQIADERRRLLFPVSGRDVLHVIVTNSGPDPARAAIRVFDASLRFRIEPEVVTDAQPGQEVTLQAIAENLLPGDPAWPVYRWSFGDGGDQVSKHPSRGALHTYAEPGSYTVRLQVVDKDNLQAPLGEATARVVVGPARKGADPRRARAPGGRGGPRAARSPRQRSDSSAS